jgi:hypothetical protein
VTVAATDEAPLQRLERLLESFVAGEDRSVRFANGIEGLLLEAFPDDDALEDLLVALASYRPGGGEYLYDEAALVRICCDALSEVKARQR